MSSNKSVPLPSFPPSVLPPPPPPMSSNLPKMNNKRRKKFKLSDKNTLSSSLNENSSCSSDQHDHFRVQVIPHLHYGLERFSSTLVILDRDNPLTRSPTLISFGGIGICSAGFQDTRLFYLDLEPPFNSNENGGSMNVEYEWKELKVENPEVIRPDMLNFGINSCLMYCKKNNP